MARSRIIFRVSAYDGDRQSRDRMAYASGGHRLIFESEDLELARAKAFEFMRTHQPLAVDAYLSIQEHNPRTGDNYRLSRWEPKKTRGILTDSLATPAQWEVK